MPEREFITNTNVCDLAERWKVCPETMYRVWRSAHAFEDATGRRVSIISGWRSRRQQRHLARAGRPTAPDDLSTHRSCPATGVDISLGPLPSSFLKATWGRITLVNGLRWGGGGSVDPNSFIPIDWQHVDRGPREDVRT